MSKRRYHAWSSNESRYLEANYGLIPVLQICLKLKRTRVQVYRKAIHAGLTKRSRCGTCGKIFVATGDKKLFFCSRDCRRIACTAQHRRYVTKNRAHIREYAKTRRRRMWGESSSVIASRAEIFAVERILPNLGFSELYHASAIKRFVPFDIIATYRGRRVLIDVTTGVSKAIAQNFQQSFAEALRMPIYVLFVKPDFSKYQLTLCEDSKTIDMHVAELVTVE